MQKVKGTQDILPEESKIWQIVENQIRLICKLFNFQEVRMPVIEHTEVFTKSIGQETDIVSKEMYSFLSRGGKSITLRPEGTAGAVRCYSENKIYGKEQLTRWYYMGQMFRAERPQKGRQRQFHQFGVELIGTDSPMADAEIITLNIMLFKNLGINNIKLKINSVGDENCRPAYIKSLKEYFSNKLDNLCEQCNIRYKNNVLRMLDCKVPACQNVLNHAPAFEDYLDVKSQNHFDRVKTLLNESGIDYVVDKRLVRGLDYYTRTAFEITSQDLGSQNAIAGGGRYDNLIETFSGKKIPAVGSALGLERLLIAYTSSGNYKATPKALDIYITYFQEKHSAHAFSVLNKLREKGISADINHSTKKIGSQLKDADKNNALFALIIGDDEITNGKYTLKDLVKSEQYQELTVQEVIDKVRKEVLLHRFNLIDEHKNMDLTKDLMLKNPNSLQELLDAIEYFR